ncbi:nucleotidyltransferase family protein [Enterococcus cecorum]|uniref:nucleotidyltransferase family protein n=1 Tax=Enterococcus cecorum TaxID=44008 RepID=UPI002ACAC623|nr:nucleotidyltransferase family protein [Enterococcus cecorum]MDZ5585314.1 nucleotidyltransferase family protein [Enterococcus cecorum]
MYPYQTIFSIIHDSPSREIKELLNALDETSFFKLIKLSEKQKVRLPFLMSLVSNYSTSKIIQHHREYIDKLINQDKRKIDCITQLTNELSNIITNPLFIKGTFLRQFYIQKYDSKYFRYSNDIDILFDNEFDFWNCIEKLNNCGFVQDEALYIANRKKITEFLTVHYKKRGIRIDLHGLTFPLQLFRNLNIDYTNESLKIENSLIILLAHSVSHERILIRDILDFEILFSKISNLNYFIEKLINNNLQEIFMLYIKQFYNLKFNCSKFSSKISKILIYKVLKRKNLIEVINIRQIDFLQRKIITNTNIPMFLYKFLIHILSPKGYKLIFLTNIRHFGMYKAPNLNLDNSSIFYEKNILDNHIKIRNDIYYVSRGIRYEL